MMIEQVTGERFESYLEKEVFKPLGLNKSSFDYTDDVALHMSKGCDGETETSWVDNEDKSASGLFSTLKDLTTFLKFLSSEIPQLPEGINNSQIIDLIANRHFNRLIFKKMRTLSCNRVLACFAFNTIFHIEINGLSNSKYSHFTLTHQLQNIFR
jgi:hypothetical protein